MYLKSRLLTSLALVAALCAPAFASDLDQIIPAPVQDEYVPVEVGSGWYIRGDVGFNFGGKHNSDEYDLAPVHYDNNFRDAINAGVGVGYRFNDIFRADATLDRVFNSNFESSQLVAPQGPCNGTGEYIDLNSGFTYFDDFDIQNCIRKDAASYNAWTMMANAYADLGTFNGFTPFIGAGVGAARVRWLEETGTITCAPVDPSVHQEACSAQGTVAQPALNEIYTEQGVINSATDWRLAYSVTAGFGYQLSQNLVLDTSYRFTSVGGGTGSIPYGATPGSSIAADGFGLHQVKMGLRYEIW
jgi:opacity protein-like surface antigen